MNETTNIKRPCYGCLPFVRPRTEYDPMRPSCLYCVEKHVGAAYVLIVEARGEHPFHRIVAIGHLFEAADEAQQWPALHALLHEARRAYQYEDRAPDWTAIAEAIDAVRSDSRNGTTRTHVHSPRVGDQTGAGVVGQP